MPARVAFTLDDLATNIPKIFDQVQTTTANHQKNYVALYKLHLEAAKHTESIQNGASIKLVGERAFENTFISMLSRAMPVKKGATVADRIIKFVGGYTKFINEKGVYHWKIVALQGSLTPDSTRRAAQERGGRRGGRRRGRR